MPGPEDAPTPEESTEAGQPLITSADIPKADPDAVVDTGPEFVAPSEEAIAEARAKLESATEPAPADLSDPAVQARIAAKPRLGGAPRPVDGYGSGYDRRSEYPSQADRDAIWAAKNRASSGDNTNAADPVQEALDRGAQVVEGAQAPQQLKKSWFQKLLGR